MADDRLEAQVGALLLAKGLTLCAAESCTGGLVMHRLTEIPGSSAYVLGGVVAYANEAKESLLGVRRATLIAHGAVSDETAEEMARGALNAFNADLAISITGIAGPGGGSALKPVGLTYIGVAARGGICAVQRCLFSGDRAAIKQAAADEAFRMVIEIVGKQ